MFLNAKTVPAASSRRVRRVCQRGAVGVGRVAPGCSNSSGAGRMWHEPEVAIITPTKAISTTPTAAMKYSPIGRPRRFFRPTTTSYLTTPAPRVWE